MNVNVDCKDPRAGVIPFLISELTIAEILNKPREYAIFGPSGMDVSNNLWSAAILQKVRAHVEETTGEICDEVHVWNEAPGGCHAEVKFRAKITLNGQSYELPPGKYLHIGPLGKVRIHPDEEPDPHAINIVAPITSRWAPTDEVEARMKRLKISMPVVTSDQQNPNRWHVTGPDDFSIHSYDWRNALLELIARIFAKERPSETIDSVCLKEKWTGRISPDHRPSASPRREDVCKQSCAPAPCGPIGLYHGALSAP